MSVFWLTVGEAFLEILFYTLTSDALGKVVLCRQFDWQIRLAALMRYSHSGNISGHFESNLICSKGNYLAFWSHFAIRPNMIMLCNDQNITWLALCYKTWERKATSLVSLHNLLQTLMKVWKKLKVSVVRSEYLPSCLL